MSGVRVFLYSDDRARELAGVAHERVADAAVTGTLFDVDGVGLALMLAGTERVAGSIVRVSPAGLDALDARSRVGEGIYRRVGVEIEGAGCWTWVAGPALAPKLAPARRLRRSNEEVG